MTAESDVLAAIEELERDEIDDLVDWQLQQRQWWRCVSPDVEIRLIPAEFEGYAPGTWFRMVIESPTTVGACDVRSTEVRRRQVDGREVVELAHPPAVWEWEPVEPEYAVRE